MGYTILRANEYSLGVLNRGTYVFSFIENHSCGIWKKNGKDSLPNGAEDIERSFKHVENKIIEKNYAGKFDMDFPGMKQ